MNKEEIDEIIKLKSDYEKAERIVKQWLDYAYDDKKIKYSDNYYPISINKSYVTTKELLIHLPTVVTAMQNYRNELYQKYQAKLNSK